MSRGQATIPVLAVGVLVLLAAAAVGVLGAAHAAAARAQRAADLAALSAGRALVARLGAADAGDAAMLRAAVRAAAEGPALAAGGRLDHVDAPDGTPWPPVSVDVVVAVPGPLGTTARARARAGLAVTVAMTDGRVAMATGGGYAGPLVYRDGKPTCPAVAGAFDVMDAAARADGIDLVVVSGFRSDAEQAVLFARHPDPRWVAPPGRSRHRDATELDIATGGGAGAWLAANAGRFGFLQRYSWEPWHYGYLPGCGGGGATAAVRPVPREPASLPGWVPGRYRVMVTTAALANGVPPAVLAALLQAESGYRPDAVSPAGAQGIAQFMPGTAAGMGLGDPGGRAPAGRAHPGVRFDPTGPGGVQRRAGCGAQVRRGAALRGDPRLRGADHGARRRRGGAGPGDAVRCGGAAAHRGLTALPERHDLTPPGRG